MNPLAFRRSLQEAWGYTAEVSEYRKSSHAVYRLRYHFVFITKYRKPALRGEIGKEVRDLTREICRSLDIEIVKGHVRPDHVPLLLDVPPRLAPSRVMQAIKGENVASSTARSPQVAQGVLGTTSLARGYFVATTGNRFRLCALRYLGFVPRHLSAAPRSAACFVADQLERQPGRDSILRSTRADAPSALHRGSRTPRLLDAPVTGLGRTRSLAGSNGPLSTRLRRFSFASLVSGCASRGSSFQHPTESYDLSVRRAVAHRRERTPWSTLKWLGRVLLARARAPSRASGQTGVSPPAGNP